MNRPQGAPLVENNHFVAGNVGQKMATRQAMESTSNAMELSEELEPDVETLKAHLDQVGTHERPGVILQPANL
jgi:hypothetical protein